MISGITGQDGSYIAEFLLSKGYEVHGLVRRDSPSRSERIHHVCDDSDVMNKRLFLHYGDLGDALALLRVMSLIQPDEVYNLGAQSHVRISFDAPEQTCTTAGMVGIPTCSMNTSWVAAVPPCIPSRTITSAPALTASATSK